MFARILQTSNDFRLTLLRLVLGGVMLPHGLQKTVGAFGGYGFEGTMGYMTDVAKGPGLPYAIALLVVLADVAPGEADARLLASAHYRRADRLLAFDGPNAAIRHAVDPQWRGVSPAVAWLAPGERRQFVQGAPASADLQRWYATALPNPAAPHPNAGPGAPPRNRLP